MSAIPAPRRFVLVPRAAAGAVAPGPRRFRLARLQVNPPPGPRTEPRTDHLKREDD